jgi:hypothetical protein
MPPNNQNGASTPSVSWLSGTYLYHNDGHIPVREPWNIHYQEPDSRQIIAERVSEHQNMYVSLFAKETASLKVYDFKFFNLSTGTCVAEGFYKIEHGNLSYRSSAHEAWHSEPLNGRVFFPVMRVFSYDLIEAILRLGGQAVVIMPLLAGLDKSHLLLKPTTSRRRVIDEGDGFFLYLGGNEKIPATMRMGIHNIMDRYVWTPPGGTEWDCKLSYFKAG